MPRKLPRDQIKYAERTRQLIASNREQKLQTELVCSKKTVLSIKVSLSLYHLKTRGIHGFKKLFAGASAIRVDLRLVTSIE